ncbi:hypothetical protein Ct61P_12321 [Colletotrichum tofieldiae]|nr:hypothetical protein Ct61P_12321 [Colletotrichum tofieldiae]
MLLATVVGEIISLYKNVSHTDFENNEVPTNNHQLSPGHWLSVNLGAYVLDGKDDKWLEMEILELELCKLKEFYGHFRESCAGLLEDFQVTKAIIGYLDNNIGTTIEVIGHRRRRMAILNQPFNCSSI